MKDKKKLMDIQSALVQVLHGAIRQQAIARSNVDQVLSCHVILLGHELNTC